MPLSRIVRLKLIGSFILLSSAAFSELKAQDSSPDKAPVQFDELLKWRCIGPFRGGRSVCASGVKGDPLTYYMGTTGGGVWKTTNAGHQWKNISDGFFKTGSVGAIAVSTSHPNVVYVGMGEHAPRGVMTSHGDGVYRSNDGGKSWKHLGLNNTEHIARILIHPDDPDIVYVAAQGALYGPTRQRGIYKTIDGGKNWNQILFVNSLTGCSEISMDLSNPEVLYATLWHHQRMPWKVVSGGDGSCVYKSIDGGQSWSQIHKGLPEEKGKMAVAVAQSNPDKVYSLIESDSDEEKGGLFVSTNGGKDWSRVSNDHRLTQRSWYYTELFVDPKNEQVIYVLSAPALRSIDGGKNWETLSGTHGDFHDLWINPDNTKNFVIANDGGAAISFDYGESWSTQNNMPTAQFYRVNVDNQFPYRIYGGQQDNSSVVISSFEPGSSGINRTSWTASAGGESAFLAFDPDNPTVVLGGSYLGTIESLNTEAKAGTNIMAAPIQYLGKAARDMRYLYNWNAPIIWSKHEPNTFYHAAQVLLRTRDNGQTWTEVSPDLTRNQDHKQGRGGGPLTNEAVGAENYGTISYVAESPHEKGVIWTGSDDGLVHVSRDGNKTWKNVTPQDLPECLVNSIEISPHDPGTVFIATTRYKFNDKNPGIFKTNDYGESWTKVDSGIPDGAFTRVVREDTEQKGLLFAGTETGLYISRNGGQQWSPFQLNLPVTPVLDLAVRHNDLIVATSGRSFWILDDLGLVRQLPTKPKNEFHLFQPEAAFLSNHRSELDKTDKAFTGATTTHGVNPANGIVIYYQLPTTIGEDKKEAEELILEILDQNGKLVNRFTSRKNENFKKYAGGPPPEPLLSAEPGFNRFVWNMRHQTMPGIPAAYIEGSYLGHKAVPGEYQMRLRLAGQVLNAHCKILKNPLYPTTDQQYSEYHRYMSEMETNLTEMHETTNQLFKIRNRLSELLPALDGKSELQDILIEGKSLEDKIKSWDDEMVQRKSKAYDDVENFPNKFTADYLFLINQTESPIPRVTAASRSQRQLLDQKWQALKKQASNLINNDVPAFNMKLWAHKIGAIWITD